MKIPLRSSPRSGWRGLASHSPRKCTGTAGRRNESLSEQLQNLENVNLAHVTFVELRRAPFVRENLSANESALNFSEEH
jgi:hypothetical protein